MDETNENPASCAAKVVFIVEEAHAPVDVQVMDGGAWSRAIEQCCFQQCCFQQVAARAARVDEAPARWFGPGDGWPRGVSSD